MLLKDFMKLRLLGRGSFGSVYKVRNIHTNETFALKEMNIKPMNSEERKVALNEVRLLASISHPNIIEYKYAFVEDGRLYIITELADGDLDHLIKKHKNSRKYLSEEQLWSYIAQICSGLDALHKHGIVHRDMKCSNILISQNGTLKLADFGVAKLMKGAEYVYTNIGTPYYLSPEQWKDQPYNEKTDIWSLGVVLYEVTALQLPFQGINMTDLSRNVVTGNLPRLPSHVGPELQNLISRLLVKNPKLRPSADEILQLPFVKSKLSSPNQQDVRLIDTIALPRRMSMGHIDLPKPVHPVNEDTEASSEMMRKDLQPENLKQQLKPAPPSSAPPPKQDAGRRPRPPELLRPSPTPAQKNEEVAGVQKLADRLPQIYENRDGYSRQYGVTSYREIQVKRNNQQMQQKPTPPSHRFDYNNPIVGTPLIFPPIRSVMPTQGAQSVVGDYRRRKYSQNPPIIGPNRLF